MKNISLVEKILNEILSTSLSYKGSRINLFGIPKFENHSKNSVKSTVNRLKNNGLIENKNNVWFLTPAGKNYIKEKENSLQQFEHDFSKNAQKNLLVMFDIPENKKAEREWFRWHLKKFNYKMIQKSVWVGPSPLPKEFMDYIKKIKLEETIKTFKLAKEYKNRK